MMKEEIKKKTPLRVKHQMIAMVLMDILGSKALEKRFTLAPLNFNKANIIKNHLLKSSIGC